MIQEGHFRVSEYDAFGPWIYKITEENLMPPLFIPYYKENQDYLMLIKIPRDIERRKAKPDMDLYDYVIGIYDDHGYILKRKDKEVEEIRFYYDEVGSVENYKSLLTGTLTITLKNDTLVIPYNAVSIEIIFELVKLIRERYTKNSYKNTQIINESKNYEIDILYENLIRERALKNDIFSIMAFQSTITLKNKRMLGLIRSKSLLSTIHLLNDRELLIINRGQTIQYGNEPVNSYSFVYIPIDKIINIKLEKYKKYNNIQTVLIKTKENQFKFHFSQENKELADFYTQLSEIINENIQKYKPK